ncbi:uncharacterized protein AB675_9902 [Cyphellophora attinorum]|uniref:Zn(2)-C6 fungal-type domain-containing protein n=1 Tax=Cyphellophora attinorum TaxID=1664694 RepID=A0A0N1NWI4_9EURO|nr:uncharacterized protein AB675_9902 [Phialophora attinorum]KPI35344.1 hypothetical protein AB675_9902 [Phialophora attinorum]
MARDAPSCPRRVLSCARCRKRKIKCDRVIPVCGQCSAAKATCAGFSNANQDIDVPRSVVQFLESAIAKLEIELSTDAQPSLPSTSPVHATTDSVRTNTLRTAQVLGRDGGPEAEFINSPAISAIVGATTPIDPSLTDLVSRVRMGLTPSSVLPAISGTSPEGRRGVVSVSVDSNRVECSTLLTLPDNVINALTRKFVRHVVPQMLSYLQQRSRTTLTPYLPNYANQRLADPPNAYSHHSTFW